MSPHMQVMLVEEIDANLKEALDSMFAHVH